METATLISTGAIATSALVGFANLILTTVLTRAIHRHSVRSAELDALRQHSEQWRHLNLAAMQNPRLQALLDGEEAASADERSVRRNVLFYILNGWHELFLAARADILRMEEAEGIIRQQISALLPHRTEVEALFVLSRGYEPAFTELVRQGLEERASPQPMAKAAADPA